MSSGAPSDGQHQREQLREYAVQAHRNTSTSITSSVMKLIQEIGRDAALLQQADDARRRLGDAGDRHVEPLPEVIGDDESVRGLRIERTRKVPFNAEKGLEYQPDRLAESLGRVLHARIQQREAAVPRWCTSHATMVEPTNEHEGQCEAAGNEQQEQQRAVARALRCDRCQEEPSVGGDLRADAVADKDSRHRIDQRDDLRRKQPEQHATCRQPDESDALQGRCVMRARRGPGSRGWPRKITPKNFTIT